LKLRLKDKSDIDYVVAQVKRFAELGNYIVEIKRNVSQRTLSQNSALHKYFELLAAEMNDAGITQQLITSKLKEGFEIPVSGSFLKDIFRQIGKDLYDIESTAKLTTKQIQDVYLVFDQGMAEKTGCAVAWPTVEDKYA